MQVWEHISLTITGGIIFTKAKTKYWPIQTLWYALHRKSQPSFFEVVGHWINLLKIYTQRQGQDNGIYSANAHLLLDHSMMAEMVWWRSDKLGGFLTIKAQDRWLRIGFSIKYLELWLKELTLHATIKIAFISIKTTEAITQKQLEHFFRIRLLVWKTKTNAVAIRPENNQPCRLEQRPRSIAYQPLMGA